MGLSDLFFHEPPDLYSSDKDNWKNFVYQEAGPMASFLADRVTNFQGHMEKGEAFQAISSAIPVKMYQDAVKAYELANTGKRNSLGGRMTQASGLDAAYQLFGLKPASVAEAQENSSTAVNYNKTVQLVKKAIIKDWVSSDGGESAQKRLDKFNDAHPAEAIRPNDLKALMRYREQSEQNAPGRDEELNRRLGR